MLAKDLFHLFRMHQWVKNLLVFAAPALAHSLFLPGMFSQACWVFAAFCAAASGVYIVNDLFDIKTDREHPRKRERPFASGRVHVSLGILGPVLMLLGVVIGRAVTPATGALVAAYIVVALSYSMYLKTQPLVDIFILSLLYTVRLYAGAVALHVTASMWLISFSGFLFLALAFLKRYAEFRAISASGSSYATRRGYSGEDIELLKTMGIACTFSSSVVLALYVNSEEAAQLHSNAHALWAFVPILLFWQARLWLGALRGFMTDDPIVYAARDWVSQVCLLLLAVSYSVAVYT